MNRSKGSKASRYSSSNKSVKSPSQNGSGCGGGGEASAAATSAPSKSSNDVSGSAKKSSKTKKSSKAAAAAAAKQQQQSSNASSLSSKTAVLSHQQTSTQNGMNSSMTNINKSKFPVLEPKKLERSHSFISRGFSKLYSSITGSRDGINKIPEDKEVTNSTATSSAKSSPEPPRFRRSLTLGSFSIKRRSIRESALEKLSEENELRVREGDSNSTSPRDSQSIAQTPSMTDVAFRDPPDFDWNDNNNNNICSPQRRMSFGQTSLADMDKDAARYGSGLMSKLKRTFSITSEKRKQMNPVWSASLQNLQSIDNMVSYDDLSFIDYDKFNEIDKRIDKVLTGSQLQLNRMSTGSQPNPPKIPFQREMSAPAPDCVDHHSHLKYSPSTKSETSTRDVKRREHKFNTDHTKNLDEGKNLYRQSLDSQKLQFLNERNRESFRFSSSFDPKAVDYLLLDNCAGPVISDTREGDGGSEGVSWKSKEVFVGEQERGGRRRNSEPIINGSSMEQCNRLVSSLLFLFYLRVGFLLASFMFAFVKFVISEARFCFIFVFCKSYSILSGT